MPFDESKTLGQKLIEGLKEFSEAIKQGDIIAIPPESYTGTDLWGMKP